MSNADRYTLETPENVEVDFELAGIGSRFFAMLIDSLVIAGLIAAGLIAMLILSAASSRKRSATLCHRIVG